MRAVMAAPAKLPSDGRGSRIRTCDLKYPKFEKPVSPCFPVEEFWLISLAFWLPLVPTATSYFRSGGHRVVTADLYPSPPWTAT
jgi:hypothetical protein